MSGKRDPESRHPPMSSVAVANASSWTSTDLPLVGNVALTDQYTRGIICVEHGPSRFSPSKMFLRSRSDLENLLKY